MGRVSLWRSWRLLDLRFAQSVTQSRMLRWQPYRLLVPYTRTMLGALLWRPRAACIGVVGLGGGSQVKWLHRHHRHARLEVMEVDADVIALRRRFRIPPDDARLRVERVDAAVAMPQRADRYDVLLVDAYDAHGIPPALATAEFYAACHAALTAEGVLSSNLYATNRAHHEALLRRVFGNRVLILQEPTMSNCVAFAWKGARPPHSALAAAEAALRPAGWRELRDVFERVNASIATLPP